LTHAQTPLFCVYKELKAAQAALAKASKDNIEMSARRVGLTLPKVFNPND